MQDAQYVDTVLGTVQGIQDEMPGRPPALRDVEQPPVRGQAFTMMSEAGILPKPLARFADQRAVLRDLQRPKLGARRTKDIAYVSLRDVAEEQAHGLPQRFGFRLVHERLELLVGFE